jgi:soluble lytic murein transglycosylase-like protein
MIRPARVRRLWIALAAPALVACAAATVSAQGSSTRATPTAPRESTTLTATGGGSLVRDFDRPPETPKADAEDVAAPTKPAALSDAVCLTGDPGVDALVREAGQRYGVDPCLVSAVMAQESGFRRFAVSPKGASGYMQLMPDTARRFGVVDIFDARQNIHAGVRYLRFLLDRFGGSLELALAGYNAGEAAVERYGLRIPPFAETQTYVRVIAGRYLSRRSTKSDVRPATGVAPPLPEPVAASKTDRPAVAWRMSVSFEPK